ncbi:ChrR family anti-sigma-E factor [Aestuariivirga sp.]|uniref:ChrR family anti-sigma-E factor n=1 Tax=Aestuariivirga sp. TaxID=2650926 RepID=UPI0039E24A54
MKISHHLDEATLMAYAAGTLGEAHSVVVAAHAAMCGECRAAIRAAEALGGTLLEDQDGTAVSDTCRAATLASLDGVVRTAKPAPRVAGEVPAPLCNLINNLPLSEIKWKSKAPGIAKFDIPLSPGSRTHLQLLRIAPGKTLPDHGHGGEELTLILRGSYSDHTGRYLAGDVADLDEDTEHAPRVDSEVECICLVATEAPTRFKSFWARLAQPFVGI